MNRKAPRWSFHLDHPWSQCVKEYGAPLRLNMWTPWGFLMAGEKSQIYDRKTKRYTDRYAYITLKPR